METEQVALVATFMGVIAANGQPINDLAAPLWGFLVGTIAAALIYLPLMAVSSDATIHIGKQTLNIVMDLMHLEEEIGYGLNKIGQWIVRFLFLVSVSSFGWAVYTCMVILKSSGSST